MENKKSILIVGFSPRLGIFLNALKNKFIEEGHKAVLIGELSAWGEPKSSIINDSIDQVTEYENNFYNPQNEIWKRNRLANYAKRCANAIANKIDANKVTDLIVWNGAPTLSQAAVQIAKQKGLRVWYMENGMLPKTLQLDPKGVNFNNCVTSIPVEKFLTYQLKPKQSQELSPTPKIWHNGLEMLGRYINKFGLWWFVTDIYWNRFIPDQVGKKLRSRRKDENVELPDKFILLPLQVQDDTQILMHSRFSGMEEVIEETVQAAKSLNYQLVIKEHPQDLGRVNYEEIKKKYPEVVWVRWIPIPELIKKADVVVTVNSSVGIEALLEKKPVVVLGDAFYNKPGVVWSARKGEMANQISSALNTKLNHQLIDGFIAYLNDYFISGTWTQFSDQTLTEIVHRVVEDRYAGKIYILE